MLLKFFLVFFWAFHNLYFHSMFFVALTCTLRKAILPPLIVAQIYQSVNNVAKKTVEYRLRHFYCQAVLYRHAARHFIVFVHLFVVLASVLLSSSKHCFLYDLCWAFETLQSWNEAARAGCKWQRRIENRGMYLNRKTHLSFCNCTIGTASSSESRGPVITG